MTVNLNENPAVQVAKEQAGLAAGVRMSTGAVVRLTPVGGGVVTEVTQRIPVPVPPLWHNPDKDTDEPNPNHPDYIKAMQEYQVKTTLAVLEALMMTGVDILEDVPGKPYDSNGWVWALKKLKIAEFDETDEFERKFAYVRYVAVGISDYELIGALSGVNAEAVAKAQAAFRSQSS